MTERDRIRDKLTEAIKLVAALPDSEWRGWILFFLETLDTHAQARGERDEYEDVLHGLWLDLDRRLSKGRW